MKPIKLIVMQDIYLDLSNGEWWQCGGQSLGNGESVKGSDSNKKKN